MIRLYAAIAAPEEIARPLARRQQGLEGARWRPAQTLHVTLRFFGEVREAMAADLDAELSGHNRRAVSRWRWKGRGRFRRRAEIRAVWAGDWPRCELPAPPRRPLRNRRTQGRAKAGSARLYRPHVTLAYLEAAQSGRRRRLDPGQ